jgi:hypothetical protein
MYKIYMIYGEMILCISKVIIYSEMISAFLRYLSRKDLMEFHKTSVELIGTFNLFINVPKCCQIAISCQYRPNTYNG